MNKKAFAVRTLHDHGVWESLQSGRARLGWSWLDHLDLKIIQGKDRADRDDDQKKAWRGRAFLEDVVQGDYLFYLNQPEDRTFAIVEVTGDYMYEKVDSDFRSYRECKLITPQPVSNYDHIVQPRIRNKLGLQGRIYRLYDFDLVEEIIGKVPQSGTTDDGSIDRRVDSILNSLAMHTQEEIQKQFPAHDLSRIFCKELFEKMGHSVHLQEGAGEHGSDLIVTVGSPLIANDGFTVGVQVFSYEREVSDDSLNEKLGQILSGWEHNDLDYGVLLTTGTCNSRVVDEHNKKHPDQQVALLQGKDISELFFRYFNGE